VLPSFSVSNVASLFHIEVDYVPLYDGKGKNIYYYSQNGAFKLLEPLLAQKHFKYLDNISGAFCSLLMV